MSTNFGLGNSWDLFSDLTKPSLIIDVKCDTMPPKYNRKTVKEGNPITNFNYSCIMTQCHFYVKHSQNALKIGTRGISWSGRSEG